MRNSRFTLMFCLLIGSIVGSLQALTIVEQDFDKAVEAAKAEDKLLLIDFYTSWCGPCKVFSNEVHDNEAFAADIAENYVMLKYDAENDTHGLTKKYHVAAYPTFVVLTQSLDMVRKTAGFGGVEMYLEFLGQSKEAADNSDFIKGVSREINLDFPQIYIDRMDNRKRPEAEQVEAYWEGVTDRTGEVPFALISIGMTTDGIMDYYIKQLDTYRELYGEDDANSVVEGVALQRLSGAILSGDETEWQSARDFVRNVLGDEDSQELLDYARMEWYSNKGEWATYADVVDELIAKDPESYNMINSAAWTIFEQCDDQEILRRAIAWMEPVIENAPDFATLDTYAWLFYKTGQFDKARRYINEAIQDGLERDIDVSDSEKMLPMLDEKDKNRD